MPVSVDEKIILSVITVTAYDLERLKITLNSYIGAPKNIEFVLVYPIQDIETANYVEKFTLKSKLQISAFCDFGIGIYQAMNLGSILASGQFLMFWNAGDTCSSIGNLIDLVGSLQRLDPIWGCVQASFDWRGPQDLTKTNLENFVLQRGGYISHQSIIVRKSEFVSTGGFDEKYKVAADYKLIAHLWINSEVSFFDYELVNVEFPNFSAQNNRIGRLENLKILFEIIPLKFRIFSLFFILRRETSYLFMRIRNVNLLTGEK
jgi:hypothetical protein